MEENIEIEILFPQIVMERKTITVPRSVYSGLAEDCGSGVPDFIWNNMSELEQEHTLGKKMLKDFDSYIRLKGVI